MLEVSGKAMDMMFDTAAVVGIPRAEVCAGFGFGDTVPQRFDWDVFARGCDWMLRRIGSPEAMEVAARECFVRSKGTSAQVHLLRLFSSPRALYWSLHRFGGHSLFANTTTSIENLGLTRLRFRVSMDYGAVSMGFWTMCAGIIAAAPCAIGYPASVVRLEAKDGHCDYFIEHTQSRSIVAKLRALFISVFSRRSVFDELEAQKAALNGQLRDLEEAHRHAERALELRTRFLTTVTHEMRTPLAGLIGLSNMLDERTPRAEVASLSAEIRGSSNRLLQIVNDVMALDGSGVTPAAVPTNLGPMIEQLLHNYAITTRTRGITLDVSSAPGTPPAVVVDEGLVLHALRCLMDNAVAFTERGGIVLTSRFADEHLEIEVSDTGCGIPEALHARIFEPFVQVDESLSRTHQGAGLGLAVARRLATMLGGDVSVRSVVGQGSAFTLRVPAVALDQPVAPPAPAKAKSEPAVVVARGLMAVRGPVSSDGQDRFAAAQERRATTSIAPRPRVTAPPTRAVALVVEDNQINQKILQRLLVGLGCQVDLAENGQIAVDACAAKPYDIIFMDLQMPVMDGFKATEEIRRASSTPIFAVTANSEQQFRDRALQVGMDGFLSKPVDRASLAAVLEKAATARAAS